MTRFLPEVTVLMSVVEYSSFVSTNVDVPYNDFSVHFFPVDYIR